MSICTHQRDDEDGAAAWARIKGTMHEAREGRADVANVDEIKTYSKIFKNIQSYVKLFKNIQN